MKHKISIGKLFYKDKFVMVFSVMASIILWGVMASTNTEQFPRQISEVPIVINLSESAQADGLKVFSPINATATVSIKGNSLIVKQIQSTDLQVVAQLASTISTPGSYTFNLSAQKKGALTDYDVVSISPNQAIISVDRSREKTFPIESNITYKPDYKADTAFFVSTPTLSSDSVTISGPEKDILQVNKVEVQYEISDTLRETKNFTADLVLYDANGNRIENNRLKMSEPKVDVTIPVLARKVMPLRVSFTNQPSGLVLTSDQVLINPDTVDVAGPKEILNNQYEITLPPLDFSTVSPAKNIFDVKVNLPNGCKNLSSIPVAKVTLDMSEFTTRQMVVKNFDIRNLAANKTASLFTNSLTVTVVGPNTELSKLTENSLVAQIDMTGKENFTGHTEMPVTFNISNTNSSWVHGNYMVNLSVTEK